MDPHVLIFYSLFISLQNGRNFQDFDCQVSGFALFSTDLQHGMSLWLLLGLPFLSPREVTCISSLRVVRQATLSQHVMPCRPAMITAGLWLLMFNLSSVLQGLKTANERACGCGWKGKASCVGGWTGKKASDWICLTHICSFGGQKNKLYMWELKSAQQEY